MGGETKDWLDILSVGDITTDAYIKLLPDQAQVVNDDLGDKWLALPFGAKLPFDCSTVVKGAGNASNAAISFARLGLKTGLVTNVGGDQEGLDMVGLLGKNKVDTRFVRVNPGRKSNYHYVLWYGDERTILVKHEDYDYHWPHFRPKEVPRWLYLTSVGEHALEYHDDIADWLNKNPSVFLAFQPGTFQIKIGAERLKRLYNRAAIVLVNREEAATITGLDRGNITDLVDGLHALGPKVVVITDGSNGAYGSDGTNIYKMPVFRDGGKVVERLGAGDAFSSTFVAAAAKGLSLEQALQWAPINANSVIKKVGPHDGLLKEKELLRSLNSADKKFQPTVL